MEKMEIRFFIFQLKQIAGLGNQGILRIIQQALEQNFWQFTQTEVQYYGQIATNNIEKFQESYQTVMQQRDFWWLCFSKCHTLSILDQEYPERLRNIYNPPVLLFYEGNLKLLSQPSIAMIGSRQATYYGKKVIEKLIPSLVKENLTIVSGLARGIDTLVHQETIRQQGQTIAVIGSGLNIFYPQENQRLQKYIGQRQLLLSEYFLDEKPLSYHFPQRNRIIAGITLGTCVIEAKEKSGTHITAELALEEGREVFAIPGSIENNSSTGCHTLLQQGAKCVWNAEHIIEEIKFLL